VAAWILESLKNEYHVTILNWFPIDFDKLTGINMAFIVTQVVGRKYSAVFGFEKESDANKAVALIRKAAPARKR